MNKRDRRPAAPDAADDRRGQVSQAASYPAPDEALRTPNDDRYSTPEDQQYVRDVDPDYRSNRDDRYDERAAREHPAPPSRGSRFRQEPDFVVEPARNVADGEAHGAAYKETADWHDPSSDERDSHYQGEYEDERYAADDHGYGDEYSEEQNTVRRSGFIFVAAIFALAVLGTAGAFAYRAMFGGPVLPALPPIIKAESGPNKIVPSGAGSQGGTARDADDNNAASRERLVSREERPVDIPPPVTSAAPRSVSTVPVFPDPPSVGGPGAVVGYSGGLSSSNPAMSTPPAPPAPAMPATTASNPSAGQVPPPAATPSVSTVAPATPAAPGPKKIRTVTIHTDQSSAPTARPSRRGRERNRRKGATAHSPSCLPPQKPQPQPCRRVRGPLPRNPHRPNRRQTRQPRQLRWSLWRRAVATPSKFRRNAARRKRSLHSATCRPNIRTCSAVVRRSSAALISAPKASSSAQWWVHSPRRIRPQNCARTSKPPAAAVSYKRIDRHRIGTRRACIRRRSRL